MLARPEAFGDGARVRQALGIRGRQCAALQVRRAFAEPKLRQCRARASVITSSHRRHARKAAESLVERDVHRVEELHRRGRFP